MSGNELLRFKYINWQGEDHTYVIEPVSHEYKEISYSVKGVSYHGFHHVLHGMIVTRDGDPRSDMENRRRTFIIARMRYVEEFDSSK